jgi:dihydroneopterin aldolase
MHDKIIIRKLELYASIGVSAAEREVGQRLLVNVEVGYDLAAAGQSDQITDTISYSKLARTVQEVGTTISCLLLEYMAEQMAQTLLERFPINDVRLQVLKTPPPTNMMIEAAGVEIYRQRPAPQG